MPNMRGKWRDQLLDLFIFVSSFIMFLGSIGMMIYCSFFLHIINFKPYAEYILLLILSIGGFRVYRKEVEP